MDACEQIGLYIPENVERPIEGRQILWEDVENTMLHAETKGKKLINPSAGRCLASLRPDRVTYWVEYSKACEEYLVHSAYSRRMEMRERTSHDGSGEARPRCWMDVQPVRVSRRFRR